MNKKAIVSFLLLSLLIVPAVVMGGVSAPGQGDGSGGVDDFSGPKITGIVYFFL